MLYGEEKCRSMLRASRQLNRKRARQLRWIMNETRRSQRTRVAHHMQRAKNNPDLCETVPRFRRDDWTLYEDRHYGRRTAPIVRWTSRSTSSRRRRNTIGGDLADTG